MPERGYVRGTIKFRGMSHQHTTYHYQHSLFKEVLSLTKGVDSGKTNAPPTTKKRSLIKMTVTHSEPHTTRAQGVRLRAENSAI